MAVATPGVSVGETKEYRRTAEPAIDIRPSFGRRDARDCGFLRT